MRKKLILAMLSVTLAFPNMVYADNLNQIQLDVQNNESDYSEGSVGSNLLSITSATISFPEIEGYYPEPGEAYVIQKAQIRTSASVNSSSKGILDIGTKVNITGYEGDWAKTENGYIYAGLLSDKFTYKANIHGKNMNSLRYAGYLYKSICNLDEPLRSLAENISITLVDSQKDLVNESAELGDKTVGYTMHYRGTNRSEIRIWANTGSMKMDMPLIILWMAQRVSSILMRMSGNRFTKKKKQPIQKKCQEANIVLQIRGSILPIVLRSIS